MIHTTFVMETHLGHATYYANLRRFVEEAAHIDAAWVEVTYQAADQAAGRRQLRRPILPAALRGIFCGRGQVQRGLQAGWSDVVLFNTQTPAAIGGRAARARPYIICTDITPLQLDRMGAAYNHRAASGPLGWYKHRVVANLLRRAARVLPWSNWVRTSLIADYGVDPARIEVIPPGIDLTRWRPHGDADSRRPHGDADSRRPHGDADSRRPHGDQACHRPLRILFVGGDLTRKGGDLLLDAFRELPAGLAELMLVTRTPVPPTPGVTVRDDLQPNAPALIALFQSSDIFVLPTRAEAFGIAAVEAGAAGLPVIATDVGGLRDIVVHGATGLVIPPGDADALAAALRRLLQDDELRRRLGQAGRARVEAHFDARRNAARTLAIIEEVAAP